jgi:transcription initiation factor TFIIIB Brf1 subunit/transcription initiation factor TFIIB
MSVGCIQSMDQFCPNCGSDAIIDDPQMGSTICSSCGHVLTENAIQSELEQQVSYGSECINFFTL